MGESEEMLYSGCGSTNQLPGSYLRVHNQQLSGLMIISSSEESDTSDHVINTCHHGNVSDSKKSGIASGGVGVSQLKGVFLALMQTMCQLDPRATPTECFLLVDGVLICVVFIHDGSHSLLLYSPISLLSPARLRSLALDVYNVLISQWRTLSCAVSSIAVSGKETSTPVQLLLDNVVSMFPALSSTCSSSSAWLSCQLPGSTVRTITSHSVGVDSHLEEALVFSLRELESSPMKIVAADGVTVLMGDIVGTACFAMGGLIVSHLSERDTEFARSHLRLSKRFYCTDGVDLGGQHGGDEGGLGEGRSGEVGLNEDESGKGGIDGVTSGEDGVGIRFVEAMWRPYRYLSTGMNSSYLCLLRHGCVVLSAIVNVYGNSSDHYEHVGSQIIETLQTICNQHETLTKIVTLLNRGLADGMCYLPKVCRRQVLHRQSSQQKEKEEISAESSPTENLENYRNSCRYSHHIYDNLVVFVEELFYNDQSMCLIRSVGQSLIDKLLSSSSRRVNTGSHPSVIDPITGSHQPVIDPVSGSHQPVIDPVTVSHPSVNDPVTGSHHPVIDPVTGSHPSVIDPVTGIHPSVIDPVTGSHQPLIGLVTGSQQTDDGESSVDLLQIGTGNCLCVCLPENMALSSIEEAMFTAAELKI